jgi:hypothetical protein
MENAWVLPYKIGTWSQLMLNRFGFVVEGRNVLVIQNSAAGEKGPFWQLALGEGKIRMVGGMFGDRTKKGGKRGRYLLLSTH